MNYNTDAIKPLKVLHITPNRLIPGDFNHSAFYIWRSLAKGFTEYHVAGRSTENKDCSFRENNLSVHLLASRLNTHSEFLFTQYWVHTLAEKIQPDIVVCQCPVLGGLEACRIARDYGAKLLFEFHSADLYFGKQSLLSKNMLLQMITRKTLRKADKIRVLSKGMKEALLATYGASFSENIVVLPPRVDMEKFKIAKKDYTIHGHARLVIVGSINNRKGQLQLLQALDFVKFDIELWLVGTGPDEDACKLFVKKASLENHVRFYGQLTHSELAELLPQADIMVQFSKDEGMPRTIMEGMAAGLPVITTNAGYCCDVVINGVTGFVLGDDPSVEINIRLKELIAAQSFREAMGRAGRHRAEIEFEAVSHFIRYRQLISSLVDNR
jgi:glycosyltransferase involved in cell wall biosynthesis